ncbi:MAG: hypothetical protein KC931_26730, partial [Candidatus Omnitrophica bacterium]|nr:hypothetical protein [Candidatus Omnitrophota bacterium]
MIQFIFKTCVLLGVLFSLESQAQNTNQEAWKEQLAKKRAEAAQQQAAEASKPTDKAEGNSAASEEEEGSIVLNGKVI